MECLCVDNYNLNSNGKNIGDLKELASMYIKFIKDYQPQGPYYLFGWSNGGLYAIEIASMLEDMGDEVEKLYLLDTYPVHDFYLGYIQRLQILKSPYAFDKIFSKLLSEEAFSKFKKFPPAYKKKIAALVQHDCKIVGQQKIKPYTKDVVLIRGSKGSAIDANYTKKSLYGWHKIFKSLRIVEMDTDHFNFISEDNPKIISNIILEDLKIFETFNG